jgi:hypothetical protein
MAEPCQACFFDADGFPIPAMPYQAHDRLHLICLASQISGSFGKAKFYPRVQRLNDHRRDQLNEKTGVIRRLCGEFECSCIAALSPRRLDIFP